MEGGREADEVWIFHVPESSFDMVLTTVAEDDLRVSEFWVGGEENALAENPLLQLHIGVVVGLELNGEMTSPVGDRCPKKVPDVLTRNDGIERLLQALSAIRLAAPPGWWAHGGPPWWSLRARYRLSQR